MASCGPILLSALCITTSQTRGFRHTSLIRGDGLLPAQAIKTLQLQGILRQHLSRSDGLNSALTSTDVPQGCTRFHVLCTRRGQQSLSVRRAQMAHGHVGSATAERSGLDTAERKRLDLTG